MMKKLSLNMTIFLLSASILAVAAYSQQKSFIDSRGNRVPDQLLTKISLDFNNIPLTEALTELADEGKFHLNYNLKLIPPEQTVSLKVTDAPAITILNQLLQNTDIGFVVTGSGQVVLVSSEQLKKGRKYTISGFISDSATGEALVGTNLSIKNHRTGCTSNAYGYYSMTIPAGEYTLNYSYLGYESLDIEIILDKNLQKNIDLKQSSLLTDTVVVDASVEDNILRTSEIGTYRMIPKEMQDVPVFLGEQDIFRTLQLLPGVTQIREADCGFYVRGGNSDQNLVLLDEAPVYNAVHLMGSFSIFNADAIRDIKLIKGSAPAKYGSKLSSVLDIQMKEGNMKEVGGRAGIGTIFSRLTVEGPLVKDRASFIVSGRRTYADIFTKLSSEESVRNSQMYFYDFNLKTNYRQSDRDRFYLSGYFGRDFLNIEEEENLISILWENRTGTFRWNHLYNEKLFSNSSIIYSRFKYSLGNAHEEETIDLTSMVNDLTFKTDFQYFRNPHNILSFGLQYIRHTYKPSSWLINGSEFFDIRIGQRKATELAAYISNEQDVSKKLKLNYGIRSWMFLVSGNADLFDIEQIDDVPHEFYDLVFHTAEEKTYTGLEPRFSANYLANSTNSIKIGYARNYQNVHMLSNSTSGTPLNVWHPSSSTIRPQRADLFSLGLFQMVDNRQLELSYELFYKDMRNQLDYKDGADVVLGSIFESEMTVGKGWAYGIELLIKKRTGRLTGWIGYTWSRSRRQFDEINNGNSFPANNDKTHDLAIVGVYKLNNRIILSTNFIYQTGTPVTIQYGRYIVDNQVVDAFTPRNAYRMPAYHRLDIGFTWRIGKRSELNFTLYNAYGRRNAYAILFEENERNPQIVRPVKLSLFSFVPSISYQIKF